MRGREAAERVPAAALAVRRHGADYGLEVFFLLKTGGVRLRGDCRGIKGSMIILGHLGLMPNNTSTNTMSGT